MRKRIILVIGAVVIFFLGCFVALKWDAIFQRGNPIPYLAAAVKLSEDNTFVEVGNTGNVYITKLGEKSNLFQMIEDTFKMEYIDQLGSCYLFSDGEKYYSVHSETYWSLFTIWTLPFEDGFPSQPIPICQTVQKSDL